LRGAGTPADESLIGAQKPLCDPQCERMAACRPDSPGWIPKKQVAANLASSPSALRQRAARVGYVSPSRIAMPRRDQPKLCLQAAYFAMQTHNRSQGNKDHEGNS